MRPRCPETGPAKELGNRCGRRLRIDVVFPRPPRSLRGSPRSHGSPRTARYHAVTTSPAVIVEGGEARRKRVGEAGGRRSMVERADDEHHGGRRAEFVVGDLPSARRSSSSRLVFVPARFAVGTSGLVIPAGRRRHAGDSRESAPSTVRSLPELCKVRSGRASSGRTAPCSNGQRQPASVSSSN